MSSASIGRRVATLEASDSSGRISYILTAPTGYLLMVDQYADEDAETFRRGVRDVWLAGGNPSDLLPIECSVGVDPSGSKA
jgi:hypothetical protein